MLLTAGLANHLVKENATNSFKQSNRPAIIKTIQINLILVMITNSHCVKGLRTPLYRIILYTAWSKRSPLCFPLAESVPSFIFLVIESFLLLGADGITFWDYSKGGRSLTGVRVDETSLST